jgi:hypothetical protein
MARTRSSYIPVGVASRGYAAVDPIGGASVAAQGYLGEYPESVVPEDDAVVLDPLPLLTPEALDSQGTPRILHADIQALCFSAVDQGVFWSPDAAYTGYAANGFWYTDGVLDPAHVPFQATWSAESESTDRGTAAAFPPRILVVATRLDVCILDADSLDVWLRFRTGVASPSSGKGRAMGHGGVAVTDVAFADGVLIVTTTRDVRVVEFRRDRAAAYSGAEAWVSESYGSSPTGLASRNSDAYLDTALVDAAQPVVGTKFYSVSTQPSSSRVVAVVGSDQGVTAFTFGASWRSNAAPLSVASSSVSLGVSSWEAISSDEDYTNLLEVPAVDAEVNHGDEFHLGAALSPAPGGIVLSSRRSGGSFLLEMDRPFRAGVGGASYSLARRVEAVHLDADLTLFVANGPSAIARNAAKDWFWSSEGVTPSDLFSGLAWSGDSTTLQAPSLRAYALARRGSDTLLAGDRGVHLALQEDLDGAQVARFTYSTASEGAEYPILDGGDVEAVALAVDPETGSISVAVTGTGSVVTEIDPSTQQAFRYFDQVGRVRALIAYRNPQGPPDAEVT